MSHIWSKEYDDKLRQRIAELEAERDRLEERLGDWQRETALAKAERDRVMRENGVLNCHIDDLEIERDNWIDTAKQHHRNEDYYRGLVVQIGEMFGEIAHVSDDGLVQEDVLCAKVPELVEQALKEQT